MKKPDNISSVPSASIDARGMDYLRTAPSVGTPEQEAEDAVRKIFIEIEKRTTLTTRK